MENPPTPVSIAETPLTATEEIRRYWRPLLAAMLGLGFSGGASLYWFGVVISPLSKEFGWSMATLSGWSFLVHLTTNVFAPFSGSLVDRIGARAMALRSIPLVTFGFVLVGLTMHASWMLFLGAFVVGLSNSALTAFTRTIHTWFNAGRGIALGIAYSGAGVTAIVGPRITLYVVDTYGWRAGFVFMGLMTLLPFPAIYFWLRERRHATGVKAPPPESGYPMFAVLKMPPFWFIAVGGILYYISYHGVQFSLIPFLTDGGMTREQAASNAGLMGVFILTGKLVSGPIFDRLRAPFVLAFLLLVDATAIASLAHFQHVGALFALAVIGFDHGAMMNGVSFNVARYFGVKFFAGIFGLISLMFGFSAIGSLLFGRLWDIFHSYVVPLYVSSGLLLGAATFFACLGFRPYFDPGSKKPATAEVPDDKFSRHANLTAGAAVLPSQGGNG